MKIKATKKILSLVLAVMMVMSTFAMMFVNAEDAPAADALVTTPKAYADAEDGEKLYDVDFSSEYYSHWNDQTKMEGPEGAQVNVAQMYDNNGTTYNADGTEATGAYFPDGWQKSIKDDAVVEEGYALKMDSTDVTGTDSRWIGEITPYDLENSTYTYQFEYFRTAAYTTAEGTNVTAFARSKFYFGNGSFSNGFGGCDTNMPNLGIEFNATACRLMRQSNTVAGTTGCPVYKVVDNNGVNENTSQVKVVLEGGEKIEDIVLYDSNQTTVTEGKKTWVGDVIPVTLTIYTTQTFEDGSQVDIRHSQQTFWQPADIQLVFGIGEWNAVGANQYYGARNLAIYKGDTSIPYETKFIQEYDAAGWGETVTTFDPRGISFPAFNYANGYGWANQGSTVVDAEGVITINRTDKGATQGAWTPSPFQDKWNYGIYEMNLTINNASRLKVGLINVNGVERIGFDILPNVANADLTTGNKDAYLHTDAQNAATLWTSAANSFGSGIVENSQANVKGLIETIVYDTYEADAIDIPNPEYDASVEGSQEFIGDGVPEDPRLVRDYGGNRANVKIVFNSFDSMITLYEKVDGEWTAISAIDYSAAIEAGLEIGAVIDFQAYNANTNATIKNVEVIKGSGAQHIHTFAIGSYESDLVYKGYDQDVVDALTAEYAAANGLWGSDWGWSVDGATVADLEEAYKALDEKLYGPQTIKLVPIVTYDELVEGVAVRGIKVAEAENNKYDVTFVGALAGDLAQYNAVGFEIVKVTEIGGKFITTTEYVESNEVYETIKANGLDLTAAAVGGDYIFTATLAGEKAAEGINVDYIVTPYTIDVDGVKNVAIDSYTFSFIDGEYAPLG